MNSYYYLRLAFTVYPLTVKHVVVFIFIYMFVSVGTRLFICMPHVLDRPQRPDRIWDSLEMGFQVVVCCST